MIAIWVPLTYNTYWEWEIVDLSSDPPEQLIDCQGVFKTRGQAMRRARQTMRRMGLEFGRFRLAGDRSVVEVWQAKALQTEKENRI
jgi:hypothetical protein